MGFYSSDESSSEEGQSKKAATPINDGTPVYPIPDYSDEDLDRLITFVQKMTFIFDLREEDWNEENTGVIRRWFMEVNETMLTIFYDCDTLTACVAVPLAPVTDLVYFVRPKPHHIFTVDGFHDEIIYGNCHSDVEGCLLKVIEKVYAPIFFNYKDWSENVKSYICSSLHTFLAYLTGLHYKLSGLTVLYVPTEGLNLTPDEASKDVELIRRLEAVAVNWATSIRTCLNDKEHLIPSELMCLPDEFDFWVYRFEVISGLKMQIEHEDFVHLNEILLKAQSIYCKQLNELYQNTEEELQRAKNNIDYLQILVRPCVELNKLPSPSEIPMKLVNIMNLLRFIWEHSKFINTSEDITNLFRNLGNQIILFCQNKINIKIVLAGQPRFGIKMANLSIDCCIAYKILYDKVKVAHEELNPELGWNLDYASIFNHLDAFIQRLYDLIEICETMIVFGRIDETQIIPEPQFGGNRAKEFEVTVRKVEKDFLQQLVLVDNSSNRILDVHNNAWFLDVADFRALVKDLEEIVENLISNVFFNVCNVEEGLEALCSLFHFSSRKNLRPVYLRKTSDVWQMFIDEMAKTNKILVAEINQRLDWLPKFSGRALKLRTNMQRLTRIRNLFGRAEWLPESPNSYKAIAAYDQMVENTKNNIARLNDEWLDTLGIEVVSKLNRTLICRSSTHAGLLECNIDRDVLDLCEEAKMFETLGFGVPVHINQVYSKYTNIKFVYENVLTVVLDYNRILSALSPKERKLFKAMILNCDRKIMPGMHKLTWGGEMSDAYIAECVKHTAQLQEFVDVYKTVNLNIMKTCEKICDLPLMRVNVNTAMELKQFKAHIDKYRRETTHKLLGLYKSIIELIFVVYAGFEPFMDNMAEEWLEYVLRFDSLIEEALKTCGRNALQSCYNTLHGDGSMGPSPLLKVNVVLNGDVLFYTPQITELGNIMTNIFYHIKESLKHFPRLAEKFHLPTTSKVPTFAEIFEMDEECKKYNEMILDEVDHCEDLLRSYLVIWDPFRNIWEMDKDQFIEDLSKEETTAETFDSKVSLYRDIANQVSMQETITKVYYVVVNSNELKIAINNHTDIWQKKLLELLKQKSYNMINSIYEYMETNSEKILTKPDTILEMQNSMSLYQDLMDALPEIEATFPSIREHFATLDKYEVIISSSIRAMESHLLANWNNYLKNLKDAYEMLDNSKDRFKLNLLSDAERLKDAAKSLLDSFTTLPTTSQSSPNDAMTELQATLVKLHELYAKEQQLIYDLNTFSINIPDNLDLRKLEAELAILMEVWDLAVQWEDNWNLYKSGNFWNIDTVEMENMAIALYRRLNRLSKQLKDRNWEILETTRRQVDEFRKTLPLVGALKNPALRKRHWDKVRELMETDFDETSEEFTLESVIEMDFQRCAEEILDLSNAATMELQIENGIKHIREIWATMAIEVVFFKENIYRIKSVDDCFVALEENAVQISTMKSTRFVEPFIKEVDYWEKTLSYIMESLENALNVQRQWLYLENIFQGEDIRKQLPVESRDFENLTADWRYITTSMYKAGTALGATHFEPPNYLLDKLIFMADRLEIIQRALEVYLEAKRQLFPRFYFISNDDLLEILGNAKRPDMVQPHMKKLFDNLNKLKLNRIQMGKLIKYESHGMFADDGEYVQFMDVVILDGPAERWLTFIEKAMRAILKDQLRLTRQSLKKMLTKRDKWLAIWPGQLCLTSSQMQWTTDCTRSLMHCKILNEKKPLKRLRKKQNKVLAKLSEMSRRDLVKQLRLKVNALITIEIHSRDVIDKMYRLNVRDTSSFEWFSQLRFYWDREHDDCVIRQTNTHYWYGYEYTGNSGRLVITPLTDRCYITLTTALHLYRGGSPKGPAGTGKTETVKDLGKALGMWVIVNNCSEGLDYKSMGKCFSGLVQTGAWGCFDEFNRINIEVLSVVAQQILSIISALTQKLSKFFFEGYEINLVPTVGMFITMNPGYAGRTELPDNLKSMFRPISMMVPDSAIIAENVLFSDGFSNTRVLAKKVFTLYELAKQQLSKQFHYDFGLRSMVALLRYAGRKRRQFPNLDEEKIVYLAMKDMNVAKFTSDDFPLFNGIMSDIFPGVTIPVIDYGEFLTAIEDDLTEMGLQKVPIAITKVIQLHETKNSRHSVMILGQTGTAKSVTWKALKGAFGRMKNNNRPGWVNAVEYPMNPKSLSLGELYGEYNLATGEWLDGVLSAIMRKICAEETPDQKWMLFDGPVDAVWIENMNSVMDDNKVLTLVNSERITMPEQVSLLFEVADLAVASPATVSRCGMVYNDYKDWGWRPYVNSWLQTQGPQPYVDHLNSYFDRFFDKVLNFKRHHCEETVAVNELNLIQSFCRLMDCLATPQNGINAGNDEVLELMSKLWFMFCMVWTICATVNEAGRGKLDGFIREMEGCFPLKDSIYDYYVNTQKMALLTWEDKLNPNWKFNPELPFYKIVVPTVDTIRYDYVVSQLLKQDNPCLLVGPVGTGKSSTATSVLEALNPQKYSILQMNMSAQTTSNNVQDTIEGKTEKRTKGVYVPVGGKTMICFMDDFNMPAKETYGSQPPLELIRQWIDYEFWYDRQNQTRTYVKQILLLAAMGPAGGGRQVISPRTLSRFNVINMTFPNEATINRIYGTLIGQQLFDFDEDIKSLAKPITLATVDMYTSVVRKMLPTPAKIHYLFNLRDISRVFQGLLRCSKDYHVTKQLILRLWIHECYRVFSDRLIDDKDQEWFLGQINVTLGEHFELTFHSLCPSKECPLFGDFISAMYYEDFTDMNALRNFINHQLNEYNSLPGVVRMDLVLFKEAIEHIIRIVRVISQPRGNMLLIGIGGSGRQSLARLSAALYEYGTFQIEVTRSYLTQEFREDLKTLYKLVGVENREILFIFNDTQVAEENFMEIVNNMLSTGEVPNLYKPDEFEDIKNALEKAATRAGILNTPETMYNFFMERSRANLHIGLCMSPIGELFRVRIRQYPALVNSTTIDWFREWTRQALLEVAHRYLQHCKLDASITENKEERRESLIMTTEEKLRKGCAATFAMIHTSVAQTSQIMFEELKRHNYVTPTNYLELVAGFQILLSEKRNEISTAANRLRNGLFKIEDTREKVEGMSEELKVNQEQVLEFQAQCDEFLKVIQKETQDADEAKKAVAEQSIVMAVEENECKVLAAQAQHELDKAMPALNAAITALDSLNKKDLTEVRSYAKPPVKVEKVMEAVMILRGKDANWTTAKRELGEGDFLDQLKNFDKDNISDKILKRIAVYTKDPELEPEKVGIVSLACKSLCLWVRAIERYAYIYKVVRPKKEALEEVLQSLAEKQEQLAEAQRKLDELQARLDQLQKDFEEKSAMQEQLRIRSEQLQLKLERAVMLVDGLAGERLRWIDTVKRLDKEFGYLVGDCLLSTAFISYLGPFVTQYREKLVSEWFKEISSREIPISPSFIIYEFLSDPTTIREWNIQGLPSDEFSTENGIIVTRGSRWPLIIDPQCQGHAWIKKMEVKNDLKIIDFGQHDYVRVLELAVQFGNSVLLQNILEYMDPALTPILNKAVVVQAGERMIKFNDKMISYNDNFRFFITTKLSNPHYSPEISTKATLVNFAVKEVGLQAQLLGIVVRKEKPVLEEQKDTLVVNISKSRRTLVDLEHEILRMLNESRGSLLDDDELFSTLQISKQTSAVVNEALAIAEVTEIEIDTAREAYRPSAKRASILFFVLMDMSQIDPMYQFSLDAYVGLFTQSIERSTKNPVVEERINNLNEYHTYAVYRNTCRGLFEVHKLLFSFHMCIKILEAAEAINLTEYAFLLKGGVVLDRQEQVHNPAPHWITDLAWDNITELDKLPGFHGVAETFEQFPRDWHDWYTTTEPEAMPLIGEWEDVCNDFQKMLFIRCLRPDRISSCVSSFVINALGPKFVEPPVLDVKAVLDESSAKTPLIFVLSPGVDPTNALLQLAESVNMTSRFSSLSLGQGQAPIATSMLLQGAKDGRWVFLANCHLSLSWMPQLDKLVETLQAGRTHPRFRLWLSSSPHPDFPISILQAGIKMTTEPPKGIKANLKRLYHLVTEEQFSMCKAKEKYKKLLFSLCYFHSILLERKKFQQLGWNVDYSFNDSDFEVSENLLSIYLDEYPETPWDALKYLIAGVNYGGHITDDWDRRLLMTYINMCYCEEALTTTQYKLSTLSTYYIPRDGTLQSYRDYIQLLPNVDRPEAFGQHPNADIASLITDTRSLFETLLSLQVQSSSGGGESHEDKVYQLAMDIESKVPQPINYEETSKLIGPNKQPLDVVLLQEIERYNVLLVRMLDGLADLQKGIKGLVVMTSELEDIFNSMYDGRVPQVWLNAYSSLKPLGSWARDLVLRIDHFSKWAKTTRPPILFWLAAYTFPTGFLTAVLQTAARATQTPIDSLGWEFMVFVEDASTIKSQPREGGVYVRSMFLEGAGWNLKGQCLKEPLPMELVSSMPLIHFRPVEQLKKRTRGLYQCPTYYYPRRSGSFIIAVDLKIGVETSDFWTKRGTAMLLSLAN